jgi:hypothetical protein
MANTTGAIDVLSAKVGGTVDKSFVPVAGPTGVAVFGKDRWKGGIEFTLGLLADVTSTKPKLHPPSPGATGR